MYNYMGDTDFLKGIEEKDFKVIKSIIVTRVIKACNWNKEKIDEVINYAMKKCNFSFEEHIDYNKSGIKIGTREEYNFEIGKLNDNFSKERYLKILRMAKTLKLIREEKVETKSYSSKNKKESVTRNINRKSSKKEEKKTGFLIVGIVIALGLYGIIKLLGE